MHIWNQGRTTVGVQQPMTAAKLKKTTPTGTALAACVKGGVCDGASTRHTPTMSAKAVFVHGNHCTIVSLLVSFSLLML